MLTNGRLNEKLNSGHAEHIVPNNTICYQAAATWLPETDAFFHKPAPWTYLFSRR